MSLATLPFQELIANQRLKSVTSDLAADLALARTEAIKRSTRVGIARVTDQWVGGWQVFDDANRDGQFTPAANNTCPNVGDECFLTARPALDPSVKVCTLGKNADNSIDVLTFGADGRVRTYKAGVEIPNVTAIVISSTLTSPSVPQRMLEFSPSGRVTVAVIPTNTPLCG